MRLEIFRCGIADFETVSLNESPMKPGVFKGWGVRVGITACVLCGAFLSGLAAPGGAMASGMPAGGFGWQFLPFIFFGWLFGLLAAVVALVISLNRKWNSACQFFLPLIAPPIIAFVGSAIAVPILAAIDKSEVRHHQEDFADKKATYHELYERLRRDPEIVLREKWYEANDLRYQAFEDSVWDSTIPYSLGLLKRLYVEAPVTRDVIFTHPACDAAFLSEHFQEAWARAGSVNYGMLASIASNPNTPRELVERVADSSNLPGGPAEAAKEALGRAPRCMLTPQNYASVFWMENYGRRSTP